MIDRRAKQRQRVLKPAKIRLIRGGIIDCMIRDISENGACLRVASALGIPEFVELVFDDKSVKRCRVVWRKETQIGVEFKSETACATVASEIGENRRRNSLPVLIVDDSPTMTHIISELVRKIGFTDVDSEHDGPSALGRLRQKRYGLVLSDWEMEPMSGQELFKEMRQDKMLGNVPIILITATAGRGAAWLAGAVAYLRKPFSETDLRIAIERVLAAPSK